MTASTSVCEGRATLQKIRKGGRACYLQSRATGHTYAELSVKDGPSPQGPMLVYVDDPLSCDGRVTELLGGVSFRLSPMVGKEKPATLYYQAAEEGKLVLALIMAVDLDKAAVTFVPGPDIRVVWR